MVGDKNSLVPKPPIDLKILTTSALILGFYEETSYYHMFNINIANYLDVQEIIMLAGYRLVVISLLLFFPIYWISKSFRNIDRPNIAKWIRILIGITIPIIFGFVIFKILDFITGKFVNPFSLVDDFSAIANSKVIPYYFAVISAISACIEFLSFDISALVLNKLKIKIPVFIYGLTIIIAFFFILFYNYDLGHRIKSKEYFTGYIKLNFKDSLSVETSENLKFIGQTHNYYFLYNCDSEETLIYKNDEIKSIVAGDLVVPYFKK